MSEKEKGEKDIVALPLLIEIVEKAMGDFMQTEHVGSNLTALERKRLISAGVSNYGFIDKAFDIARDNPKLAPPALDWDSLHEEMDDYEEIRQLVWVLDKFSHLATDLMMIRSDKMFRQALFIYNNLRELSRARVPGAQELYEGLLKRYHKGRKGDPEPTLEELERNFNQIHGLTDDDLKQMKK